MTGTITFCKKRGKGGFTMTLTKSQYDLIHEYDIFKYKIQSTSWSAPNYYKGIKEKIKEFIEYISTHRIEIHFKEKW